MTEPQTYTYTRFKISQAIPSRKIAIEDNEYGSYITNIKELFDTYQNLDANEPPTESVTAFPSWYLHVLRPLGVTYLTAWNLYVGITPLEEFCQNLTDEQVKVGIQQLNSLWQDYSLCDDENCLHINKQLLSTTAEYLPTYAGGEKLSLSQERSEIDNLLRYRLLRHHGLTLDKNSLEFLRTTIVSSDNDLSVTETYVSYDDLLEDMSVVEIPDGFYETAQPSFSIVARHYE